MTYDDYILVHQKERDEADGCDLCEYEDRQPWEEPCTRCKRNCMDLYEHMKPKKTDKLRRILRYERRADEHNTERD